MHISVSALLLLLKKYQYTLLFPLLVIEGPILTILAGFLISTGDMSFWPTFWVVFIADLTGDTMYYAIGRYGTTRFIRKWGHKFGVTDERLEKIENLYKNHGGKTLLIAKFSHGLGWPAMVAAGTVKMPYKRFMTYNTSVSLVKTVVLLYIGIYYGKSYEALSRYIGYAGYLFLGIPIAILIFYYFFWKKILSKNN